MQPKPLHSPLLSIQLKIVNNNNYVLVIGGSNTDLTAIPDSVFIPEDSNPGSVSITAGGVGRNIAENIARLGLPICLLSAIGDDYFGNFLQAECSAAGINTEHIIVSQKFPTSAYLCVMNEKNDLAAAVSDMKIMSEISAELISDKALLLRSAEAVVVDNNIGADSLQAVKSSGCRRILFDAVSGKKLQGTKDFICDIDTVKLNSIEAEILSDIEVADIKDAMRAAEIISSRNINHIFITMGAEGALYLGPDGSFSSQPYRLPLRNATGAGDAFLAGITYGHYNNIRGQVLLNWGTACAAAAAASKKTVSDQINPDFIKKIIAGG